MNETDFYQPSNYVNRELSWIDFNGRVLEEAVAPENPLLERANFLGITQSNVDEFFMVRVASLHKLAAANVTTTDASGLTPEEQLNAVNRKEHRIAAARRSWRCPPEAFRTASAHRPAACPAPSRTD